MQYIIRNVYETEKDTGEGMTTLCNVVLSYGFQLTALVGKPQLKKSVYS